MAYTILSVGAWIVPTAELMRGTMIFFVVGMATGAIFASVYSRLVTTAKAEGTS